MIRKGTQADIESIKKIADANKDTLGFVTRPALLFSVDRYWLFVAELDSQIVGFCNYRHRRDSQTTIYEICVSQQWRGQGIGKALLDVLATESQSLGKAFIQLKAIAGIEANGFYEKYGFTLSECEAGKKQALNIWRLWI